ncbi:23S rRNA (guanine(745)-N(1))-methyltransferase [Micromonospora saelicesensis]|nr:23S rRNA (guanine(745)-N(1))-methyltransferase [Micromonospora saelicesensis]
MDPRILDRLRCPVCGEPLAEATAGTTGALRCPRRHSFDIARQGYVNLLAGRAPHVGDSAEMVAARADFLAAGHYDLISAALSAAAAEAANRLHASPTPDVGAYPLVVDAGAGTGRYLGAVLAALPDAAWTCPSRRCAARPARIPGPPPRSPTPGSDCRSPTPRPPCC